MHKRYSLLFLLIILLALPVHAQWTFDYSNEGFETSTYNEQTTPWPFRTDIPSYWSDTGGNPDGHIYHDITQSALNNRLFSILQTSVNGLGDLTGMTVCADFRREGGTFISGSGNTPLAYWSIGDSIDPWFIDANSNWWISKEPMAVDLNNLNLDTWVPQQIEMIEANFMKWANSANGSKTFDQLIADYVYIGITIVSDQVTENRTDPWNQYTNVGGVSRLLHYGTYSNNELTVLRLDNFRSVLPVDFDIHPTSWPNPINTKSGGVVPAAILGTESFDVTTIDPSTVLFEGVSPVTWAFEDVTMPATGQGECNDTEEGPDGFVDLTLKFDTKELVAALGEVNDGDALTLTISGSLLNGQSLEADDCVIIITKGKPKK